MFPAKNHIRNQNGVQPSPAAAMCGVRKIGEKSSALRAEDVAAPGDGRTPANSSQPARILTDSSIMNLMIVHRVDENRSGVIVIR